MGGHYSPQISSAEIWNSCIRDTQWSWPQLGLLLQPHVSIALGSSTWASSHPSGSPGKEGLMWPKITTSTLKLKISCRTWLLAGLGFICLRLSSSSASAAAGAGAQCCSRRMGTDRLPWPLPGMLFLSPCLKSWRQLGLTAHSEFHLRGILTAGSLAPVIRTILVQKYTKLLLRGSRPAKLSACWPQTNQELNSCWNQC